MRTPASLARAAGAAVALALGLSGAARGDGVSVQLEPGYVNAQTDTTDQTGRTARSESNTLNQSYRLTLDKDLFRNLALVAGGTFQDAIAWTSTGATSERTESRASTLFARLNLGTPILSAGAGFDRRQQSGPPNPLTLVSDTWTGYATWRPAELPQLDLRLDRSHTYATPERAQDTTVTSALLAARYGVGQLDLRYTLNWSNPADDVNRTQSTLVDQTVQATYNDAFFDKRTSAYVTATVDDRSSTTTSSGTSGTVSTQQLPIAGLSLVETFPAPTTDTLARNPALADGNTSVSAALDIGFAPTLSGDRNLRDVGVQLANAVTSVNTVFVWVDKALRPDVVSAFTPGFAAYTSDDNARWTEVAVRRVVFGSFQNRFEITIDPVQARYVKVVTAPLPVTVTADRTFADVFVTEVQVYLVLPATAVPRQQTSYTVSLNATATTALLRRPDLAHDVSVNVSRRDTPSLTTYSIINGLTLAEKLRPTLGFNARLAQQDVDGGRGHEGQLQWSASLLAHPLPTLYDSLTYSGQLAERPGTVTQSLGFFNRAELYEGISAQANLSGNIGSLRAGGLSRSVSATAIASLIPNRFVTLTGTWLYNASWTSGGDQPESSSQFERVDGSLTVSPAPALSVSASVARVILGPRPTTLASFLGSYSPLRGDLQLSLSFSRSLDTALDATTQLASAGVRWNVRPGVVLSSAYTLLDSSAQVAAIRSRVFLTTLLISW